MLLKKLTLINFRPFKGEHVIEFSTDKDKNITLVMAENGAGKTTLLQIMSTLDKADSGSVVINGVEVGQLKEKELSAFRNKQIGFVFQFHQLLPEFTALENVMIPALIGGKSSELTVEDNKVIFNITTVGEGNTEVKIEMKDATKFKRVTLNKDLEIRL